MPVELEKFSKSGIVMEVGEVQYHSSSLIWIVWRYSISFRNKIPFQIVFLTMIVDSVPFVENMYPILYALEAPPILRKIPLEKER